jgi:hypothetical protein
MPGGFGFQGRSFTPPANGSFRGFAPGGFRGSGPSGGFARGFGGGGFGGAITFAGKQTPKLDPKLLRYLETHKGKARYLVATTTSTYASLLILQTGQPIMALGGYQGWDRILAPAQLSRLVSEGVIRFFLIPASGANSGPAGPGAFAGAARNNRVPSVDANLSNVNDDLISWVRTRCTAVPSSAYQTTSQSSSVSRFGGLGGGGFDAGGPGRLYDCAARAG